ncbi:MAG: MarP family serine protease [Euzebya sp.]
MNIVDVVLLVMLIAASIRGWRQGAVSQLFAFGGAVLGLVAGGLAGPSIASRLIDQPGIPLALTTLGILVLAIVIGQGLGYVLGLRLKDAAARNGVGVADSLLGIAVGVATVVATVWIAGSVLAQGPIGSLARQVRESTVLAVIDDALPPPPDLFGRVAAFLDTQGFPQVFAGLGGSTAPPVDPPSQGAVAAAAAAGTPSTVQVEALGCGGVSSGSGVVITPGVVVTNAHVVAGGEVINVRDSGGTHEAVAIHIDPNLDLAVLSSPSTTATPLPWTTTPADRGTNGATLGFPGGQRELNVRPAAVRSREEALGRDIYGGGVTSRQILTLEATVRPGDSGGPFVNEQGQLAGLVFAASTADGTLGYALTAERIRPDVESAIARNTPAPVGSCRY